MIQLSHQGNIHILAINASEGNAVDEKLVAAMHEALDSVEAVVGDGPGALVITGSGKAFSVGINVPVVMQYAPEKIEVFDKALMKLYGRLMNFKMPTVAAINGHAFAAGAFVALACDYRVMRNDRGWFCFSEVDAGVPIGAAVMAMAKDKLSASVCRDAVLTGKRYTGAEGLAVNIIDEVCSEEDLIPTALEMMSDLAEKKRGIFKTLKTTLYGKTAAGLGVNDF